MKASKIVDLVRELKTEAWKEGFHTGVYGHGISGHTPEGRTEMMNHKAIVEQIYHEIQEALAGGVEP